MLKRSKFPQKKYISLKYGIENLNQYEINIIKNLPKELNPYIPKKISLEKEILIMERIKNYDNNYSKSLQEIGKIDNNFFWDDIYNIKSIFDKNELYFLDIFFCGNNIMVKKESETKFKPIIIDFKKIGRTMYPFQFNLIFKSEQKKKFNRRFNKFIETFKI